MGSLAPIVMTRRLAVAVPSAVDVVAFATFVRRGSLGICMAALEHLALDAVFTRWHLALGQQRGIWCWAAARHLVLGSSVAFGVGQRRGAEEPSPSLREWLANGRSRAQLGHRSGR